MPQQRNEIIKKNKEKDKGMGIETQKEKGRESQNPIQETQTQRPAYRILKGRSTFSSYIKLQKPIPFRLPTPYHIIGIFRWCCCCYFSGGFLFPVDFSPFIFHFLYPMCMYHSVRKFFRTINTQKTGGETCNMYQHQCNGKNRKSKINEFCFLHSLLFHDFTFFLCFHFHF